MYNTKKLILTPEFMALTKRQLDFVLEYLTTENATRSYMKAYGSKDENVAAASSSALLRTPKIKGAVELAKAENRKKIEKKYSISRDAIIKVLATQMNFNPDDMLEIKGGVAKLKKPKSMKAIKSFSFSENEKGISFSFSVHDKVKAAEVLAKMTGALDADHGEDKRDVSAIYERASELIRRRKGK